MSSTILIAGGSGLIGSRLTQLLTEAGYRVHILSRKQRPSSEQVHYFQWDFATMTIDTAAVEVDYIINLTGAGIADARWTNSRKKVLVSSRVKAAELIKQGLTESAHKPKAYISASAVGYYGDRGSEVLTERSAAGQGFMADCCVAWEDAATTMTPLVDRLVINRIGIVLSKLGGALPKIMMTRPVFSYFGDGKQYYPWIHIDDVCRIFMDSITDSNRSGIYNAVSPTPLTNKQFTSDIKAELGGVVVPAPVFALRLALGEMANVVLNSNNVIPERLTASGQKWQYPDLGAAVADLVERNI